MPITHINRKRKVYYLHQGTTKTGKPKYYFSLKTEGTLVETLPEGYEIYEHPEGGVYLRVIKPQLITDDELKIVNEGLERYAKIDNYIVDIRKKNIDIYTSIQDSSNIRSLLLESSQAFGRTHEDIEAIVEQSISYCCDFRFVLEVEQKRLFQTQRYCYRSSIDDWIDIGSPDSLNTLVKNYVKHIGQDSIYELL